jgi:hypothetical protein
MVDTSTSITKIFSKLGDPFCTSMLTSKFTIAILSVCTRNNNTFVLCILCTLMPQILPLPTLTTFRTCYEVFTHEGQIVAQNCRNTIWTCTPYNCYLQKDWSHSMQETPGKCPIEHLKNHILQFDKIHLLAAIVD